jgi:hypothetical protein
MLSVMSCEESGGRVVSEELLHLLYPEDETTQPDEDERRRTVQPFVARLPTIMIWMS